MSFRLISALRSFGILPTISNGMVEGAESDDSDPSKPRKATTLDLVISNSIWIVRNVEDQLVFALDYAERFLQKSIAVHGYVLGYVQRFGQKTVAFLMNGVGFFCSVGVELMLTSQNDFKKQWLPLVEDLKLFLVQSGIADELARGFSNYRFLSNVAILAQIQYTLLEKKGATGDAPRLDRRQLASLEETNVGELSEEQRNSIIKDGNRLMKYTTAAYGVSMIDAAEIDVYGSIRTTKLIPSSNEIADGNSLLATLNSSLKYTKQSLQIDGSSSSFDNDEFILGRISEHIGIPEKDIYPMNLFDDQVEALRFFVVIDHENKAVVLSIRGSFTVKEILIDVAAFSRPFCGGEAHSEMANAAETIWGEAGETVTKLLFENPEYELIVTGHSLGAGAAVLVNILLHQNNREAVDGRPIRCFAFSSPPVFAGDVAKDAIAACTNYIYDSDIVPFLSVDSVRRIFAALEAVERSKLSTWIRVLILWGSTEVIKPETLERVESALHDSLPPKEGAPELLIPASANVWMRTDERGHPRDLEIEELVRFNHLLPSNFVLADSAKLNKMGISLDPLMISSHFPNGYECALHNLR